MMASGRLIDYLGEGLFSARPVTPNLAAGALGLYYATDTNVLYGWDGSAWDVVGGNSAPITATTAETGTTLTATGANAWNYTRFTNAGGKTYTFDSAETYATNAEYHGRNVGAGNLTIAQAGSFVITAPTGGSLVIPQGQSFFLKITGTNTADLILQSPSGTGPPPSSPATYVDNNTGTGASVTTHNITYMATVAAGDLIIAIMAMSNTVTATTLDAAWTAISVVNGYVVAYRVAAGTEGGTTVALATTAAAISNTWRVDRIQAGTYNVTTPLAGNAAALAGVPYQLPTVTAPGGGWASVSILWLAALLETSALNSTSAFPFPDNRQAVAAGRINCFSTKVLDPALMWQVGLAAGSTVARRSVLIGVNSV